MKNYYWILRIGFQATTDEVKAAYRRRAQETHPDSAKPDNKDPFSDVSDAYETLSKPESRRRYDEQLVQVLKRRNLHLCSKCGKANDIPPIPPGMKPVCSACNAPLSIDETQRRAGQRSVLVETAADVIDDLGSDVLVLAGDALREGMNRLRTRWGIKKRAGS